MRCVHCLATETPLWRAGPSGPKTLCNACGVRWKKTGSVIPRAKRPSTAPQPTPTSPKIPTNLGSPAVRKRARVSTPPDPVPIPPASPPDPRAAAAAAAVNSMPAPKPISVYRVSDAARSKYESVFTGLMAVHRAPKSVDDPSNPTSSEETILPRARTRTQTTRGHAFFAEVAPPQRPPPLDLPTSPVAPLGITAPCASPPPVEKKDEDPAAGADVYVTEVHAPSPSPSPPPIPRVQRQPEGGGFKLMIAVTERKETI